MRGILAIAKKDMRSLFMSPLFYIIAGLCTTLWSLMYIMSLRDFAQRSQMMAFQGGGAQAPNIHYEVFAKHISLVNFIMILATAALTMRLFAEEKKNRTFDLLLTSPVNATQIVLGKFFGGLAINWMLVLISFLYPVSLALFAKFDWGPLFSAYIGLFLLVGCYVAIGTLASALTESPVLAVLLGLIFNVGLWFLGALFEDADLPFFQALHEHLSIGNHFVNFLKGGIHVASLAFFLSVMAFCVFATQRVIESSRWR
jgi:ABC-2 type transport system permease protein